MKPKKVKDKDTNYTTKEDIHWKNVVAVNNKED